MCHGIQDIFSPLKSLVAFHYNLEILDIEVKRSSLVVIMMLQKQTKSDLLTLAG